MDLQSDPLMASVAGLELRFEVGVNVKSAMLKLGLNIRLGEGMVWVSVIGSGLEAIFNRLVLDFRVNVWGLGQDLSFGVRAGINSFELELGLTLLGYS